MKVDDMMSGIVKDVSTQKVPRSSLAGFGMVHSRQGRVFRFLDEGVQ